MEELEAQDLTKIKFKKLDMIVNGGISLSNREGVKN
jgi:hypothetical protein